MAAGVAVFLLNKLLGKLLDGVQFKESSPERRRLRIGLWSKVGITMIVFIVPGLISSFVPKWGVVGLLRFSSGLFIAMGLVDFTFAVATAVHRPVALQDDKEDRSLNNLRRLNTVLRLLIPFAIFIVGLDLFMERKIHEQRAIYETSIHSPSSMR